MPEPYSLPRQNLVGYDFVFIHKHVSKQNMLKDTGGHDGISRRGQTNRCLPSARLAATGTSTGTGGSGNGRGAADVSLRGPWDSEARTPRPEPQAHLLTSYRTWRSHPTLIELFFLLRNIHPRRC